MENFEKAIDRPIKTDEEDILGFKNISSKIAESIKDFPGGQKTFTISIEGEWGSGKTSLANLVENKIKDEVIFIHFNPWTVENFEQLTKYFFSELIKEIARNNFDAKLKEDILKDLEKLAKLIIPNSISFEVLGFNLGYNLNKQSKEKTLYELKDTINRYLQKMDKKIIIVVDDIDRLTDKETETFFRLIKGIADFDNLIYILLYDKQIVANSLEKFKSEKGEKYLDKTVQYSISIPKPFNGQIINMLRKKLEQILKHLEKIGKKYIYSKDDKYRLYIIDKYVKNLRDLNKITAIMSFEYPAICENVNLVDYLIISLIRIHNIALYNSIKNNRESYIGRSYIAIEKSHEIVLKNFKKEGKFLDCRGLLEVIFPIFSDDYTSYQIQDTHKNKPLASKIYFDNYFAFDPSSNTISTKEYNEIKDLMFSDKKDEFIENIIRLNDNDKSRLFINMLYQIDFENLKNFDDVIYNGIINAFSIVENREVRYASQYFKFGLRLFGKLKDKNIIYDIFKDERISLLMKADILYEYQKVGDKFLTDAEFDKLNLEVKSEFEKLTLKEITDNKYLSGIKILRYIQHYELSDMHKEIKEKFLTKKWFFKILNLFKYHQHSLSEDQYFISKKFMQKFLSSNKKKIDNYIKKLDVENLSNAEKNLIDMWHKKENV
ncbi:MAG: KAP family NTPase [Campylobacteraceae bacterium]|jgi:hypothetical protein|nr:KAP family NTPase [Campylobacteraceae bacterium]